MVKNIYKPYFTLFITRQWAFCAKRSWDPFVPLPFGSYIPYCRGNDPTSSIKNGLRINDDVELIPRAYQLAIYDSINRHGNTLVVLPTGLGKCLEYSQPILLNNGNLVKIGDLFEKSRGAVVKRTPDLISVTPKERIEVISLNDALKFVDAKIVGIHKIRTGTKLKKITTAAGSEIIVTPEHPLLTLNEKLEWKQANSFIVGENLAIPAHLPEPHSSEKISIVKIFLEINSNAACFVVGKSGLNFKECRLQTAIERFEDTKKANEWIEYVFVTGGKANTTPIKAVKEISPDLFYWAGLIIAEGTSYGSIKFFNEDYGMLSDFSSISENIFGLKATKIKGGLRLQSTALHYFARNLFNIRNQHSREKTISGFVMRASNKHTAQFLSALYDGEGSVRKDGLIEFITASKELAHQLCYLLLRFGIRGRYKKKLASATNSSRPKIREYYRDLYRRHSRFASFQK